MKYKGPAPKSGKHYKLVERIARTKLFTGDSVGKQERELPSNQ